jgi:hypothetical protein
MLKISRTTLSDLEEELRTISFDYDNPIQMCDKSIESIVKHLRVLKEHVLNNQFQKIEDEIHFFKSIKPKFTSKLIYFKKVRKFESGIPVGGLQKQLNYCDDELNKLNVYFTENLEFYNYYRLGSQFLDNKLFTRSNAEIDYNLEPFYYELDDRFSTTHDFKVAMLNANEIFLRHIEHKITDLSNNKSTSAPAPFEIKTIKWTESKTSLIELIYALHAQKTFNNGKIDIAEMAKYFEKIFDIELGEIYRVHNEIKNRKINKTKFLDILKENLIKRFDEQENR